MDVIGLGEEPELRQLARAAGNLVAKDADDASLSALPNNDQAVEILVATQRRILRERLDWLLAHLDDMTPEKLTELVHRLFSQHY